MPIVPQPSLALVVALLALAGVPCRAQDAPKPLPSPPKESLTDPESLRLLEQMAKAHLALKTFRADLTVRSTSTQREEIAHATIAFERPGKARVTVGEGATARLSVTDGVARALRGPKVSQSVKAEKDDAAIRATLTAAEVFIAPIFAWLCTDAKAATRLLPGKITRLGKGNDERLDSVAVDVVVADIASAGGPARLTFAIGRDDHLLRRLSVTARRGGDNFHLAEIYSGVQANPELPASLFAVPPGPKPLPAKKPTGVKKPPPAKKPTPPTKGKKP